MFTLNQSAQSFAVDILSKNGFSQKDDPSFYLRLTQSIDTIAFLFGEIYGHSYQANQFFEELVLTIAKANQERGNDLKQRDKSKEESGKWFLSNDLVGMSLYVDRFSGNLKSMETKLDYFEELGVNFLHLMPLFESPAGESDGGYAVSNFRKIDERYGTLAELIDLRKSMQKKDMYLMLDIVLNHTSHRHEWAEKAKQGDKEFQDYFYMYDDRWIPNQFDASMPEIFPESSPDNFTFVPECNKWVMTVFHDYQWDLNYMNPAVFRAMLDNILFYGNLGVDVLRIDAPAFIWKQTGTSSQNLPQAHTLLRLIKQCVEVATPGMAILGEAIVAPKEIIKYFGSGEFLAKECDFAYNATHMALQWDMLASGETKVMLAAQHEILKKPYGTSWITYTRCHDDIGLGYDDYMIAQTGKNPYEHRKFLKDYFTGNQAHSPAKGALFSSNPKTGDARISGSLASLCGLEKALEDQNEFSITLSIQKIVLMQAHSFFIGGLPIIFYGDELGYTNDYSYLNDSGKNYDNRWMHRPVMDWDKNQKRQNSGSIESQIFESTKKLISIRKKLNVVADHNNLTWLPPHNIHVAGYLRKFGNQKLYGVFNFSAETAFLTWYAFKEHTPIPEKLLDHWTGQEFKVGLDHEYLIMEPYTFHLFEPIN
ncbi:alpha-amylase family glycosyl hydrolase [Algoriphagus winogradskyi]|uniref:Amylosucrase n=1 Tax=Algoriphagus winogradskyi TaxID=237017 RepID=A0ABY1NR47_9BACT|nr:alpha-amylase family glycosyl hydrolase [Algoriphagus winogradskyi]SMP16020.1 amylosucrase [Algoriphagus winogradskyi]